MDARYIAIAIPLFFIAIAIEWFVLQRRGLKAYRFADSITSLSCGIGQQVLGIALRAPTLLLYNWVQHRASLFAIKPTSVIAWVAILVLLDLLYWVFHWASHRVNFLWATHAVHHQSEEYNLSTALRQSWFAAVFSWVFYLPLAVIGFPVAMFISMLTLNTLYQFWIHTRGVRSLGPLEWFLNTPAHHRVHHGIDPEYIDKNYGGIFIVWDRLFKTFTPERDEPAYGTVKPLASFNPAWANFAEWERLASISAHTQRLRDKIWIWFAPPEWMPQDMGGPVVVPPVDHEHRLLYAPRIPTGLAPWIAVQFLLVGALLVWLLLSHHVADLSSSLAVSSWMLIALVLWGGLFEGKPWALFATYAHLGLFAGVVAWTTRAESWSLWAMLTALAVSSACLFWFLQIRSAQLQGIRKDIASRPRTPIHRDDD